MVLRQSWWSRQLLSTRRSGAPVRLNDGALRSPTTPLSEERSVSAGRVATPSRATGIASKEDRCCGSERGGPEDHAQEPGRIERAPDQREASDRCDTKGRHVGRDVLHDRGQEADRNKETA